MKQAFLNLLILCAQRVPIIRDIPAVRDAGTIDGAIRVLQVASNKLALVAAVRATEASRAADVARAAAETEKRALADKARAENLANKFADLLA